MSLAEGVTASDQRDGFFVVHGHAGEGFADIVGRGDRIRIAIRSFWIHVDQTHLHRAEWILEESLIGAGPGTILLVSMHLFVSYEHAAFGIELQCPNKFGVSRFARSHPLIVAGITAQPGLLGAPVNVLVRFPNVLAPTSETEGLEAHRFQGDIASEDDQVGP